MKKVTVFIGLYLVLGAAGLVLAAVDEPLVNRTFDTSLEGWSVFPEQEFVIWDEDTQSALLLPYVEGEDVIVDTDSILSQLFLMPINAVELSFDITMITKGPGCETDILDVTIDGKSIYQLTSSQVNEAALNGDSNVKYKLIDQSNLLQYAVYKTTVIKNISNFCGSNVTLAFTLHNENNDDCETSVLIDNVYVGGMKDELWPPNHKYHFELYDLINIPDDNGGLSGRITSIYSDEPEDVDGNGDGNTLNDIMILSNSSFEVRAERQGASNGRVYGIAFQIQDENENITETGIFLLGVPHSQSGVPPVDDGPGAGYTVYNNN